MEKLILVVGLLEDVCIAFGNWGGNWEEKVEKERGVAVVGMLSDIVTMFIAVDERRQKSMHKLCGMKGDDLDEEYDRQGIKWCRCQMSVVDGAIRLRKMLGIRTGNEIVGWGVYI